MFFPKPCNQKEKLKSREEGQGERQNFGSGAQLVKSLYNNANKQILKNIVQNKIFLKFKIFLYWYINFFKL